MRFEDGKEICPSGTIELLREIERSSSGFNREAKASGAISLRAHVCVRRLHVLQGVEHALAECPLRFPQGGILSLDVRVDPAGIEQWPEDAETDAEDVVAHRRQSAVGETIRGISECERERRQ